jgi:superfamily II DNA helicase RecQ
MSTQRSGRGVTLLQLSELFRGSKSKQATKFLDVSKLRGFGAGKKYQKRDIDRITHAMVYEKILTESSVQNAGGFHSDYVSAGLHAPAVQNRQRKFIVEFPNSVRNEAPASTKKQAKEVETTTTKKSTAKKTPKKQAKKTATKSRQFKSIAQVESLLASDSDSGDDDSDTRTTGSKSLTTPTLLPHDKNRKLVDRINDLVGNWATEEQQAGNKVFCKFTNYFVSFIWQSASLILTT